MEKKLYEQSTLNVEWVYDSQESNSSTSYVSEMKNYYIETNTKKKIRKKVFNLIFLWGKKIKNVQKNKKKLIGT